MLKSYRVFNVAEIEGLPASLTPPPVPLLSHERIAAAQALIDGMPNPPALRHEGGRAFYRPSEDLVCMPDMGRFLTPEDYHSTLFHEFIHSTGHLSRLSRDGITKNAGHFGSNPYAKEELIAEMGAAFLCAHAGISPAVIENQAAYIDNWRAAIKADPKCVITAAAAAQKAADYILGRSYES
jgi:antirestriction protein ArdC